MKPFNLDDALAGKPVKLRDGSKAYVLGRVPETLRTDKALHVAVVRESGGDERIIDNLHLTINGNYFAHLGNAHHQKDIIGMWEEPIKYRHINGRKFPEPHSEPLEDGQSYFAIDFDIGAEVVHHRWYDDSHDNKRLCSGLIHTTQEAAQAHADAINSLFSGELWHEPSVESVVIEPQMSKRGEEWVAFSAKVLAHIEDYTVPQYGDAPNDSITAWSDAACVEQIGKYAARYGKNAREGQEQLDLLKMAHYACIAFHKQN